jgi:hypothetical protein
MTIFDQRVCGDGHLATAPQAAQHRPLGADSLMGGRVIEPRHRLVCMPIVSADFNT